MPELRIGEHRIQAAETDNLLECLLAAGEPITWSCRAGHCQTCLVRALSGLVPEEAVAGLTEDQQAQGWLLACQCQIIGDMELQLHDPQRDSVAAQVLEVGLVAPSILRLRIQPERPRRFHPGQHMVLWLDHHLGRPYSIASQPGEAWLEFHLRLHPQGLFSSHAAQLKPGDHLHIGVATGHFHYDLDWHDRPLLLLAQGTGLAPVQAIARDALQHGHPQTIDLWHWSFHCYLQDELEQLAVLYPQLRLHLRTPDDFDADLASLRPASRQALALTCGSPDFVQQLRRSLFMAGLPGRQMIDEAFLSRAQPGAAFRF